MKAVVLYHSGGAENLSIETRPIPSPAKEQILVKVKAFGLNRSELMTRKGLSPSVSFPRILGIECVGEVVADPSGTFQVGQKVAALMGEMGRQFDGSYAEYTVLPREIVFPFESKLEWAILGAMPEMFHTVFGSLHLALQIQANETLLIRGGTSSVGMLAIQLAKILKMRVLATTRKKEKTESLLKAGADFALIDEGNLASQVRQIFPEGVDKVLELVGTSTLPDSLLCAKLGGKVCMTGMLSEQWSINHFAPMDYIPATVSLTTFDSGAIKMNPADFQVFIKDVEAGNIQLNIDKVFTLDEIIEAHKYMESNMATGKIVVIP